jgi:hypothetical protein
MADGTIDLDMADDSLRKDMERQTYEMTARNQLKITSKTEMKRQGLRSPDHLDAAIYSFVDVSYLTQGPAAGLTSGDTFVVDPWALLEEQEMSLGMPV